MPEAPTAGNTGTEAAPLNEQEMMEQVIVQMMIFGPMLDALQEDREGEE